jgi:hypothetical protein
VVGAGQNVHAVAPRIVSSRYVDQTMNDSLIAKSGQLVSFRMALVSIVLGTIVMMAAPRVHQTIPIYVAYPLGVILAIGGTVFLATRIRCPHCHARILWEALRRNPGELHEALYREGCDRCGHVPGPRPLL